MKVCVVGLGAVGGLFAGWLGTRLPAATAATLQLSALARGETLAAVQRDGLRLHSAQGTVSVPLQASDDAAALGRQDLVIVAVKGPALAAVAPAVAALCGPRTQVLAAMNGVPWWFFDALPGPCQGLVVQAVDPGGKVHSLIPAGRVIGCVVHLSSTAVQPGCIRHVSGQGLILGRATGGSDGRLQAVATLLSQAGFAVTLSERIQREVWFKLWGNMTMNPISALTGATCDRILDDPLVRQFCSAVMLEAQAIGAAFGIPIEQRPEERHAVTRKLGAFKTSMLHDVEAGRPLEIDALLGAVHEIGLQVGIATPNVDALFGLLRLMAASRGLGATAAPASSGT
jgi:2-dehydropantoate 2-reductase